MGLENPIHIVLLLMVLLLVFGAKRLPEMGKSLGEGMRGFKDSISGQTPVAAQSITTSEPHIVATPATPAPVAVAAEPQS